jgi:hypothetical protein
MTNLLPAYNFFDVLQDLKTGRFFVVTKISYEPLTGLFGKVNGFEYRYNDLPQHQVTKVMNAYEAWERGVLQNSHLIQPAAPTATQPQLEAKNSEVTP